MQGSISNARDVVQAALAKVRADRQRQIAERAQETARAARKARKAELVDQHDEDSPAASEQRYDQLNRIMLVIELVAPLRYGATVAMVHPDICQEYGKVSARTVRRDLQFLESLGLVDDNGGRWTWRDSNFRSIVFREVASSWRKAAAMREAALQLTSCTERARQHLAIAGWHEPAES